MKNHIFFATTILAGLVFSAVANAATADNRDVVHDWRAQVITNSFGNCVRTKWSSKADECGIAPRQEVQAQAQEPEPEQIAAVPHTIIEDEARTVYFDFNKAKISAGEDAKLDTLANTLKSSNDISGVSIVGYADRIGNAGYNDKLSQKRAKAVEKYLKKHGYLNTSVAKTRWLGESTSVTQCANGMKRKALISCLQKDRRVTLEIQYREMEAK